MNRDSSEFADEIIDALDRRIENKIKKLQFVKAYPATVVAVNSDNTKADVKMPYDDVNIIQGLKNKTHEILSPGDMIYIFSPTNNMTNCYVAVKF